MIFNEMQPYIYIIFLLLACGYAVKRGYKAEYVGATIMVLGSLATAIVVRAFGTSWTEIEYGILFVDLIALLALIHLTIVSDRFWPIWATAFHLLAISIHAATAVAPEVAPWAFATGAAFWAYPMLLALAVGAHEYVRPAEAERLRTG